MKWTLEAEDMLKKVPPFVRFAVKNRIEELAQELGQDIVTREIVQEAYQRFKGKGAKEYLDEYNPNLGQLNRKTSRLHREKKVKLEDFFAREGVDPLRYAFPKKEAVHAFPPGESLSEEEALKAWTEVSQEEDSSPPGYRTVYVHFPFCISRCLFCGFYMYAYSEEKVIKYIDALIKEIKQCKDLPVVSSRPIQAIYLGGGSPSALPPHLIEKLLDSLRRYLPLANDVEITMETRVIDITPDKVSAWFSNGVTRVSVGVQSFETEIRQRMGRKASRKEILEALELLAYHDKAPVIIDLIYGLPGQTLETWEKDLHTLIEETNVQGVDVYQLNIYRGGLLAKAIKEGKVPAPADIPQQAEMFALAREKLLSHGFKRLSVCHFARDTRERNIYNRLAKAGATCIPFGCGAGGRIKCYSFFQEGDFSRYIEKVNQNHKPIAAGFKFGEKAELLWALAGQIDELNLNLRVLGRKYGEDIESLFKPLLKQWEKVGLIKLLPDGRVIFTPAGEFWSTTLAQRLIDYYQLIKGGVI